MGWRDAFIDRVLGRIDKPTQVKLHWRSRQRGGSPHAHLMSELVAPGDTVIDIGANWGLYTFGLSELVGPEGHVIAVEPGPELTSLRAGCARRKNVAIVPLALSDEDGTGRLAVPEGSGTAASALAQVVGPGEDRASVEVRLARLDSLELPSRSRLSFVKCDVEGHEDAVLRGGERTVREAMPALLVELEERHRDRPISDAFELLSSWGYVGFALTPAGLRPLEQFDLERDQRAHLVGGELPIVTPRGYINDFLFVRPGVHPPLATG